MTNRPKPGPVPTVSRRLSDGRIVELLYDPERSETALAVAEVNGDVTIVPALALEDGSRLEPYSAHNNLIATGCLLLPSGVDAFTTKAALSAEVKAFLERYVDLSPFYVDVAVHYVLLSWVYDAFNELPYLRFRGDYGTGKTRALLAIGSLCYKPFFASGASTVSPIFHVLDAFRGTLVLDEADFRFSDATAQLTKILNNGNMAGLPVLRTMTNKLREFNPRAFRVFGPKLVAMRRDFSDAALESRFLTEEMGLRPLRAGVPIQLPTSLALEAAHLRNKLLAWRFHALAKVGVDPSRQALKVEPRLNQTTLSLLSIMDDPELRSRVHAELEHAQSRLDQDRAHSLEGVMVRTVTELFASPGTTKIAVAAIAEAFGRQAGDRLGRAPTAKWTGWFLRERLRITTVRSHGVFVVRAAERPKLDALALRYGLTGRRAA